MILIAAVLAISLISLAAIKMTQKDGKEVIVTVDGKEVYKTSIKKDQIYQIPEKMARTSCRSKMEKLQ